KIPQNPKEKGWGKFRYGDIDNLPILESSTIMNTNSLTLAFDESEIPLLFLSHELLSCPCPS
ncbi:hypothetical protein A2U01_0064255, partial [Trifolium medium]|nr:hypothetical protein [Trifolium medium]